MIPRSQDTTLSEEEVLERIDVEINLETNEQKHGLQQTHSGALGIFANKASTRPDQP